MKKQEFSARLAELAALRVKGRCPLRAYEKTGVFRASPTTATPGAGHDPERHADKC
jgi:hypothetical protein